MSDQPTLWVTMTYDQWEATEPAEFLWDENREVILVPATRTDLFAALGGERMWFCDRMDGSYYGPCTPGFLNWDGWTDERDWRHRHQLCEWVYIIPERPTTAETTDE